MNQKKKTDTGVRKVLHVELFENRHLVPSYVKQSIFEYKPMDSTGAFGWCPMDHEEFYRVATEKFFRWKAEGYTDIVVYLSGLVGATIEVINAATTVGIKLKFMHFSYNSGSWVAQYLLSEGDTNIEYTVQEKKLKEEEKSLSDEMSQYDERFYRKYAQSYGYMQLQYNMAQDKDNVDWEALKTSCLNLYNATNDNALEFCIHNIIKGTTNGFYTRLRQACINHMFSQYTSTNNYGGKYERRKKRWK